MTRKILFFLVGLAWVSRVGAAPDQIIPYKRVGDVDLTVHVFNPPGHQATDKASAMVFFFGGGWIGGSPSHFYRQSAYLASRGMVVFCVDYRTRSKYQTSPVECVKDGKSAMRWVRAHAVELGIDPNRIAAGGGSAGGHIAAATAVVKGFNEEGEDLSVSCRPDALVLFNPVFDNGPGGYGHERVKKIWRAFSPLHNLDGTAPPTLVMFGTQDEHVPVATAKAYKERMDHAGVRCDLRLYEGEPHGFFNDGAGYEQTLLEMDAFLTSLGFLRAGDSTHMAVPVSGAPNIEMKKEKPLRLYGIFRETLDLNWIWHKPRQRRAVFGQGLKGDSDAKPPPKL